MTKQEVLKNLEKLRERMESSNKFDLADALAITDALIYLAQGNEIMVEMSLPDGRQVAQIAQEVRRARAGKGLQNGI